MAPSVSELLKLEYACSLKAQDAAAPRTFVVLGEITPSRFQSTEPVLELTLLPPGHHQF